MSINRLMKRGHIHNGIVFVCKEITTFSGKRMELEITMLGEISQTPEDKHPPCFPSDAGSRFRFIHVYVQGMKVESGL